MIRIVGLSATLPNYIDVAEFLRYLALHFPGRILINTYAVFLDIKAFFTLTPLSGRYHLNNIFWESKANQGVLSLAKT